MPAGPLGDDLIRGLTALLAAAHPARSPESRATSPADRGRPIVGSSTRSTPSQAALAPSIERTDEGQAIGNPDDETWRRFAARGSRWPASSFDPPIEPPGHSLPRCRPIAGPTRLLTSDEAYLRAGLTSDGRMQGAFFASGSALPTRPTVIRRLNNILGAN